MDTLKRGTGKMVLDKPEVWEKALNSVLYGYRQPRLSGGMSSFELLYGTPPHVSLQLWSERHLDDSPNVGRVTEILGSSASRASRPYMKGLVKS